MKRMLFLLIIVMSPFIAIAQDDEIRPFLLPEFEKGLVTLKSGLTKLSALLNYDMVEERMIYMLPDSSFNELDARNVSLVNVSGRIFVPIKKSFYERILVDNEEYYIAHKCKVLSKGRAAGYGTYSQTASIRGMVIPNSSGVSYMLASNELFEGIDETVVLVKNGNKYVKITSLKVLVKQFLPHKAKVEAYAKENKINFKKANQVRAIVEYAYSL